MSCVVFLGIWTLRHAQQRVGLAYGIMCDASQHGSMAEQRFCKPWVGGSTPSAGSRKYKVRAWALTFFHAEVARRDRKVTPTEDAVLF